MNNYNEIHAPIRPDFQFSQPSAVKHIPHSVEYGSRWNTYGSSSGWSADIHNSAEGEYLERKHFYLDISPHDSNTLNSSLTEAESIEFLNAFGQTKAKNIDKAISIESHNFNLTRAFRISDFTPCNIPTACIALSECLSPTDNIIYPVRDTCGCCAHHSVANAIFGALKEALERQFLLKYWLTKTYTHKINHQEAISVLTGSTTLTLFKELSEAGELCIFNLTDHNFPGSCILLCYGNNTTSPSEVKYCAGMDYSDSLKTALEKSIIELWQTYRFIKTFTALGRATSEIDDPYLRHFLECNKYEIYTRVTNSVPTNRPQPHSAKKMTIANLLNTLRSLNLNGYLYLANTTATYPTIYYCKYLSPNLFLHMNNSSNFNTLNTYSRSFLEQIIPEQQSMMVPFP